MANILNNAAGGVLGAAVTTANSGGGSGTPWDFLDVTGLLEFGSVASHGTLGYHLVANATRAGFGWGASSVVPSKTQSFRAYLRLVNLPSSEMQIITPWNNTQFVASVNLATDGKLRVAQRGGAILHTSVAALALNQWYRIEFSVGVGVAANDGVVRFAFYVLDTGTPVETLFTTSTADLGTTNVVGWRMGKLGTTGNWESHWDSVELDPASTTLLGPYVASLASIRPSSVLSNPGGWSNVGGASGISAGLADELDTTYAQTPASPVNAQITFTMNGRLAAGTPTVSVRLSATATTPSTFVDVALMQGTTVIATRNFGPLTTSATDYGFTLTAGEASNITDRGDLRVRVTGNQP
jgi:hypothetical protein